MTKKEVMLVLEKETKNTWRYREETEPGQPEILRNIYLPKWLVGKKNPPKKVKVTIEF